MAINIHHPRVLVDYITIRAPCPKDSIYIITIAPFISFYNVLSMLRSNSVMADDVVHIPSFNIVLFLIRNSPMIVAISRC